MAAYCSRCCFILLTSLLSWCSCQQHVIYRKTSPGSCNGGSLEVQDSDVGSFLTVCGFWRNSHFGAYHHEAIVMPALATRGEAIRRALVLDGADGGAATQLLKSNDVQEVVLVTDLSDVSAISEKYMSPISDGFKDERITIISDEPFAWVRKGLWQDSYGFDLIVVDPIVPNRFRGDSQFWSKLKTLQNPNGVLSVYGASLWRSGYLLDMYKHLSHAFERVYAVAHATVEHDAWHDVSFIAGAVGDSLLKPDWTWWQSSQISTIMYTEATHGALLTPSVVLARLLGLRIPLRPDIQACQERDPEVTLQDVDAKQVAENIVAKGVLERKPKSARIFSAKSKFQHIHVYKHDDVVALHLDQELQLTSRYGDFYHEALVHPAIAALGKNARRVLIIGGGDGGVATTVLRHKHVKEVVQLEIDEEVIKASKTFLPHMAQGYSDARMNLIVTDAIKWVEEHSASGDAGSFDLCVIDTTDEPLESLWTSAFYRNLKALLAPGHGAVVQNLGTQGTWLRPHHEKLTSVWSSVHVISTNTPDYPSPYLLGLATDKLDPLDVDWSLWDGSLQTVYYHPSLHARLFAVPHETLLYFQADNAGKPGYNWKWNEEPGGADTTATSTTTTTTTTATTVAATDGVAGQKPPARKVKNRLAESSIVNQFEIEEL